MMGDDPYNQNYSMAIRMQNGQMVVLRKFGRSRTSVSVAPATRPISRREPMVAFYGAEASLAEIEIPGVRT